MSFQSDEPQLYCYLQIRPWRITQAGFEIGSGISINHSLPEKDADFLKKDKKTYKNCFGSFLEKR